MTKTHWKKSFNPDYLGAYSLEEGKDLVAQIERVENRMVKNADGKEEQCLIAVLVGQKPMILNKTNCKTIAKLFNSPYIETWVGKHIQIGVERVRAFGDVTEALRVRPKAPATGDAAKISEIKAKIRELLPKYTGGDIDAIRAQLNAARENKTETIEFLLSIQHKLIQ